MARKWLRTQSITNSTVCTAPSCNCIGALISGDFKAVFGLQTYGLWYGPRYPNATTNHSTDAQVDCKAGCLL